MKKPKGQLKRWSYSTWSQAKRCKFMAFLSYIDKPKDGAAPQNFAMMRGEEIHKKGEHYLKGNIKGVPKPFKEFATEIEALRKAKPIVEEYWNFTEKFKPTAPYQGWCVVKSDAAVKPAKDGIAVNIDYKTGKEYPEHEGQAELSSVATFGIFPEAEGVVFEFWYTDIGKVAPYEYGREELRELRAKWIDNGKELMALRRFPAEPSEKTCAHCFHRSDKGGRCHEWKKA